MFKPGIVAAITGALFSFQAHAQEADEKRAFIEANILAVFYHELGHAVIDVMEVPIFGQEEDAADVMSVLLIDWLYEEDTAQAIAMDSAFGYINDPDRELEVAYWGVHGPDEQRFFNHVCLFYGANPDLRDELASSLGLPDDRAETCPEEYELAADSWGYIFDEADNLDTKVSMVFSPGGSGEDAAIANDLLANEVEQMNKDFKLPQQVSVSVESCGEANAFYDPEDVSIVFCSEFVTHLDDMYERYWR
ncbi:MAG: DUF4344 domain-containing metallopeptidase [Pseudomonadota bacterium]